jgi:hypothetical protein
MLCEIELWIDAVLRELWAKKCFEESHRSLSHRERVTRQQELVPPHPPPPRFKASLHTQSVREKHLKQREILREA